MWADMVTGNFFSGLGVGMLLGRGFTATDETGHAPVAVLSYAYWTRRFARNSAAIGDTLFIKGVPFTIVGVTAEAFAGVEHNTRTELWIPIQSRTELKPWGRLSAAGRDRQRHVRPSIPLQPIADRSPGSAQRQP